MIDPALIVWAGFGIAVLVAMLRWVWRQQTPAARPEGVCVTYSDGSVLPAPDLVYRGRSWSGTAVWEVQLPEYPDRFPASVQIAVLPPRTTVRFTLGIRDR